MNFTSCFVSREQTGSLKLTVRLSWRNNPRPVIRLINPFCGMQQVRRSRLKTRHAQTRRNSRDFCNDSSFSLAFARQKYEVEFLLQQQWYDPRLRYSNRSQYEFLNAIHHYDDIWLPDTYFIMHGDFKDPLIPVHFALRIYRNGTVNYLMRYSSSILSSRLIRLYVYNP